MVLGAAAVAAADGGCRLSLAREDGGCCDMVGSPVPYL